jgi:hypothetical protein
MQVTRAAHCVGCRPKFKCNTSLDAFVPTSGRCTPAPLRWWRRVPGISLLNVVRLTPPSSGPACGRPLMSNVRQLRVQGRVHASSASSTRSVLRARCLQPMGEACSPQRWLGLSVLRRPAHGLWWVKSSSCSLGHELEIVAVSQSLAAGPVARSCLCIQCRNLYRASFFALGRQCRMQFNRRPNCEGRNARSLHTRSFRRSVAWPWCRQVCGAAFLSSPCSAAFA